MPNLSELTYQSSPDEVAQAILEEIKARGYTYDEAIGVIADGLQESGLRMIWSPNKAWFGYYQQDSGYPNRTDPKGNVLGFLDRLDVKRKSGGHGDIWLNIFWLQQRPSEASAADAYNDPLARRAYLTEIKSQTAKATALVNEYWGQAPPTTGTPDVTNRPDFNEVNQIGYDAASPHGSVRSRQPINFFIHTQEGNGDATNLAAYLRSTSGAGAVSYHYTIRQDLNDNGVTVVDVIDTDLYAWAVLSANVFSINLCFAGSFAGQSREEWLKQSRAIDVAAYLAVQDAKKYGFSTEVIPPPYAGAAGAGISDHKYVTQKLGIGTHTDVGDNFPWDVFAAAVAKYAATDLPPVVIPTTPPTAPPPLPVGPADDQLVLRWNMLGGQTVAEALAEVRDEVIGTSDRWKAGTTNAAPKPPAV
jgi:N-acetyl-anhydromuramyl-L-alanine amidase AmpD